LEDAKFFQYECSFYNSLCAKSVRKQSAQVEIVPCTTIDAFCEQHGIGAIDVLKIDAERSDLLVLKGARIAVANRPPSDIIRIRFVATYIDQFDPDHEFLFANALFVLASSGEQLDSKAPMTNHRRSYILSSHHFCKAYRLPAPCSSTARRTKSMSGSQACQLVRHVTMHRHLRHENTHKESR
jgi:hypothetical protein